MTNKNLKSKVTKLFDSWNLQRPWDDLDWRDKRNEVIPELVNFIDAEVLIDTKETAKKCAEWLKSDMCWENDLDGLSGSDLAEAVITHFICDLIGDEEYEKHIQGRNL